MGTKTQILATSVIASKTEHSSCAFSVFDTVRLAYPFAPWSCDNELVQAFLVLPQGVGWASALLPDGPIDYFSHAFYINLCKYHNWIT